MQYPCIFTQRFLQFEGSKVPFFEIALARLAAPGSTQTLLDMGTCFGQDVRMYAFRCAPVENLFGSDLYSEFLELGKSAS